MRIAAKTQWQDCRNWRRRHSDFEMITKMSLAVMYNALYYAFNDNVHAEEDNIQTAETCNTRQRPEQRGELK